MTADLSFITPEIAAAQRYHWARLEGLWAGQTPREVIALAGPSCGRSHGLAGNNEIDMLAEPEAWLADVLADMAGKASRGADRITFRPLVIELDALGVHWIDLFRWMLNDEVAEVSGRNVKINTRYDIEDNSFAHLRFQKGAMMALELVSDPKAKTPAAKEAKATKMGALKKGMVLLTCGTLDNVIRLHPSMIMPDELLEQAMDILEESIGEATKQQ